MHLLGHIDYFIGYFPTPLLFQDGKPGGVPELIHRVAGVQFIRLSQVANAARGIALRQGVAVGDAEGKKNIAGVVSAW